MPNRTSSREVTRDLSLNARVDALEANQESLEVVAEYIIDGLLGGVGVFIRDGHGNLVTGTRIVEIWLSDDTSGALTATAPSAFTPTAELEEVAAGKHTRILVTNGYGSLTFDDAVGGVTWHVFAALNGRVYYGGPVEIPAP